jgi:hypothetical protein
MTSNDEEHANLPAAALYLVFEKKVDGDRRYSVKAEF